MAALVLAACAAIGVISPHSTALSLSAPIIASMRLDMPLKAPAGWTIEEQDRATILTPGDVTEGKFGFRPAMRVRQPWD